jgi:4-hydroxy 2-oxovalerate aldolase
MVRQIVLLDCTLRDGGYYNDWDFPVDVINDYLQAMSAAGVTFVELGFRSLRNEGFKGACAFSTDEFIRSLKSPPEATLGVMVNASELLADGRVTLEGLSQLFPESALTAPIGFVRIACHIDEFGPALPASEWLKQRGYFVGFNLMQIAGRTKAEIESLAAEAAKWPLDVLYFADSMGSMNQEQAKQIVSWLRTHWSGELGIHTHDNMGLALQNTLAALDEGVTWLDATVSGMGRGPGNAKTEQLIIELADRTDKRPNIAPLLTLINRYFKHEQKRHGWGTNTYYYLAGKYGIHPTYVQGMLADSRYGEEDILAVIDYLRTEGGKKFSLDTLDAARHFYRGEPRGTWQPSSVIAGRDVLLLGSGPGVNAHHAAIEAYIRKAKPFVMALNTQNHLAEELIDVRVACHPIRLLADCQTHTRLPQPLITPASMLPEDTRLALKKKKLLDFGLGVQANTFAFRDTFCLVPNSLVVSYALAVAASGGTHRILLAGFDGYGVGDPRTIEMQAVLTAYEAAISDVELAAVTPSNYSLPSISIYSL